MRIRRVRRVSSLTLVVVLLALSGLVDVGAAVAQEPSPTTTAVVTGDAPAPANTPQPTGRAEPPRRQRFADTAIWIGLIVVLVGVVAFVLVPRLPRRRAPS